MNFNSQLVEKYLNGTASAEEAEKVLNWFQTEQGQQYLEKRFEADAGEFGFTEDITEVSLFNKKSENLFLINPSPSKKLYKRGSVWAVAAAVAFLISLISVLQVYTNTFVEQKNEVITKVYKTATNEHQIITLSDGTRIRLNENSEIQIDDFKEVGRRSVSLSGEAFFEVSHNPDKPFQVRSAQGLITVLGTAFNVKTSSPSRKLLIVAVSEGQVSLRQNEENPAGEEKILSKNEIGLFDIESQIITKESADVNNYFTWMHGRVIYNKTPFKDVLKQLNHIYQIENEVTDRDLYDLNLTADFSERSLDNVLETIAHSLDISVKKQENQVTWSVN
jgi:ferric-dicitrate binding protein FerR (iron transport regulator)